MLGIHLVSERRVFIFEMNVNRHIIYSGSGLTTSSRSQSGRQSSSFAGGLPLKLKLHHSVICTENSSFQTEQQGGSRGGPVAYVGELIFFFSENHFKGSKNAPYLTYNTSKDKLLALNGTLIEPFLEILTF